MLNFFAGFVLCFIIFCALFFLEVFLSVSRGKTLFPILNSKVEEILSGYKQRPIIIPQPTEKEEEFARVVAENDKKGQDTKIEEILDDDM